MYVSPGPVHVPYLVGELLRLVHQLLGVLDGIMGQLAEVQVTVGLLPVDHLVLQLVLKTPAGVHVRIRPETEQEFASESVLKHNKCTSELNMK